ncbi:tyrosine-type recombinase/integrase [Nitrospira sp. BLG_1]|uniref:tyrosine-type recombinase/integrase n=1 Tax=Nitrospira sp. BLG_1 TaxID=3395883 RepID=UPI0039BC29BB
MGITKRSDSYYIEFRVVDDGKTLSLALESYGGKLKRWKVGSLNKTMAKQQEALIKTRLLSGQVASPTVQKAQSVTFRQWAEQYLALESVKRLRGYAIRKVYVENLVEFFGDMTLGAIRPEDVSTYRAQRAQYKRMSCPTCQGIVARGSCTCGWKREDAGLPVSIQTINHDHMTLTHMLNVARSPQFKLVTDNPASHVPKPNPHNERDRIATPEEWERLKATLAPHLRRLLTVAYDVGPRRGELLKLEWSDVDLRRKEFVLRRTKNGEVRVVPMTPAVHEIFLELFQERRLDTPRVFLYKDKAIQRIGTAFKAACRRAGITNLRVHDFRHTASTNLRRAGVDTATAMKIVGHKSDRMHRRYNTIEPDDLHKAAAKLHTFRTNTVITPEPGTVGVESVSA